MQMAISIEEMATATARPLMEGLEEGAICPCCDTSTCASLAVGRKVAMHVHEDQAEKLRETAAMLKQAFQTVCLCTPVPAAYMWQNVLVSLYVCVCIIHVCMSIRPMCLRHLTGRVSKLETTISRRLLKCSCIATLTSS